MKQDNQFNSYTHIKAKFIGVNSLGYIHGKTYELLLNKEPIKIRRLDGTGVCIYESMKSFFKNWCIHNNNTILIKKNT